MSDVERSCYVGYDVTDRTITVQFVGEDEHPLTPAEALALSDELLAAVTAEHEHRILLDEPIPLGEPRFVGGHVERWNGERWEQLA